MRNDWRAIERFGRWLQGVKQWLWMPADKPDTSEGPANPGFRATLAIAIVCDR